MESPEFEKTFFSHFSSVLTFANLENLHIPLMSSTRIPFSNTRLKFSLKIRSVRTDFNEEGANSTLSVARINKSDSGNYTCSVGQILSFTTSVHVLNGRNMLWIFTTLWHNYEQRGRVVLMEGEEPTSSLNISHSSPFRRRHNGSELSSVLLEKLYIFN